MIKKLIGIIVAVAVIVIVVIAAIRRDNYCATRSKTKPSRGQSTPTSRRYP